MKKLVVVCLLLTGVISGIIVTYSMKSYGGVPYHPMTQQQKAKIETKVGNYLRTNMSYFDRFDDKLSVKSCKITYRKSQSGGCAGSPASAYTEFQIDLKDVQDLDLFEAPRSPLGRKSGTINFTFKKEIQERFDKAQALFKKLNDQNDGHIGAMWAMQAGTLEKTAAKRTKLHELETHTYTDTCSRKNTQWLLPNTLSTITLAEVDRTAVSELKRYLVDCNGGS